MKKICKLCGEKKELQKSHIIPKFVFDWMKDTGGKYFRTITNPNVRIQDGFKSKFFCKECEQKFSKVEKWFVEHIFRPYLNENIIIFPYTRDLGQFIISILYRVLIFTEEIENNEIKIPYITEAIEDWKYYLLGQKKSIKFKNIHLIFIPENWGSNSQPNEYIYRYFSRVSDGGVFKFEETIIVFAKFARFYLFVELNNTNINFRGSEINLESGIIVVSQFIVNEKINQFFINRASQVFKYMESKTSVKQKTKITNEFHANLPEFILTDLGKAIKKDLVADINPFGFKFVFNYNCDCCGTLISEPDGFLLRTFEIIKSTAFWKSEFLSQNIGVDKDGLAYRIEYFKQISSNKNPWIICDGCIEFFDVNLSESKKYMLDWIEKKGDYYPPQNDDFRKYLSMEEIENIMYKIVTIE